MLYRFETEDSILNAYPLGDYDARLFLTWAGGSAYHFRVLAYVGGEVEQVLEAGNLGTDGTFPDFLGGNLGTDGTFPDFLGRNLPGFPTRWGLAHL
jgi:hypothetical protein